MRSTTSTSDRQSVDTQLFVLGAPRLAVHQPDSEWVDAIKPSKSLALLTYLALAPRGTASRDRLCDLLWSDREVEEARTQLRQTLYLCRRSAPHLVFATGGDSVTLTTPLWVDAVAFTAALHSADLGRAIELYSGDFFDGYAAPGAKQFQLWADLERARYRAMAVGAVETLGRRTLADGRTSESLRLAERLRQMDPDGEASWRLQLEAFAASGDQIAARATAGEFEAWLAVDDREPEPSSIAALRLARRTADRPVANSPAALRGEMVGREPHFAALHRAWAGARGRTVTHVHVVSETGGGKTRLVTEFADYLRAHHARVLAARAHPGDRTIAFGFCARLAAAFAQRAGAVGVAPGSAAVLLALNPAVSSVLNGAPSPRALDARTVGLALTDLIAAVADDAPFALLLDDLHWVDEASLAALTLLTIHLELEAFLVVSTSRPHYGIGGFANAAVRIDLTPLGARDVEALISSLGTLDDAAWARELTEVVHARSGGNPLIVHDLLRVGLDAGILARRDGAWQCLDPSRLSVVMARTPAMQQRIAGLGDQDRRLLLPLALAGVPIAAALVAAASGRSTAEGDAGLRALEERGFVRQAGDEWIIGHDAIFEALAATATPEERRSTHAALGEEFSRLRVPDAERRALHHLIAGNDWDRAAALAVPVLLRDGKSVRTEDAVRALVGPDAPAALVRQVVRAIPLHRRLSRTRWGVLAASMAVAAAGAAWGRTAPALPALAVAIAHQDDAGRWRGAEVALDRATWNPSEPLRLGSEQRILGAIGDIESEHHAARPGTDQWVALSVSPDSGEGDVYLMGPDGARERLTFARGQDIPGAFAPDGSQLVLSTTRWSERGYSALAILEIRTGRLRRLTTSEGTDQSPRWSPDGSRIAFYRYTHASDKSELCVVDTDGAFLRCASAFSEGFLSVIGWRDPSTVLVLADSAGVVGAVSWDVGTGRTSPVDSLRSNIVALDPSGRWLLARGVGPDGNPRLTIAPADAPSLVRQVVAPGWRGSLRASFVSRAQVGAVIDSIVIAGAGRVLTPGVPHLLGARGITHDGRVVEVPHMRWSVTGAGARVDSFGALLAADTGVIEVVASAGGWRRSRVLMRAALPPTPVVAEEDWDGDPWARWRPFGEPHPRIDTSASAERAFLNSGDGSFFSGAYRRTAVPAGRGLALDLDVSTPITSTQWQVLGVALVSGDSAALAKWDHRSGYPSFGGTWGCMQLYPQGERPRDRRLWGAAGNLATALGADGARIDDGRPWRLRLQVFPDGRCGVAINGVALFIQPPSGTGFSESTTAHAVLMGSSVGTRIAVRRVKLTVGVPSGVDWSRLVPDGGSWVRGRDPESMNRW